MKSASEYIIETLKSWNRQFKDIELCYAFQNLNSCHLIEVSPEYFNDNGEQYRSAEEKLWMDFMDKYPDEEILITTPSACHDMLSDMRYNSRLDSDIKVSFNTYNQFHNIDLSCQVMNNYTLAA